MKNHSLVTITYTLADGQAVEVEVSAEVAAALRETDLKERALQKQDKRHIAMRGFAEGITENYASLIGEDVADTFERMEECAVLHQVIECLPEVQRRRVKAYFFDELSLEEIAESEHVRLQSVHESIQSAVAKLKKLLRQP